ncbi:MAG: phospholipase [Gemmatimonadaceae bacterium]
MSDSGGNTAGDALGAEQGPAIHHMSTVRTGRYYTLGATLASVRRVWFVLHGYGQLAERFLRHFEGVIPSDTLIVAPEGLSRFYIEMPRADGGHLNRVGAAWMTKEDRDSDILDTNLWLNSIYARIIDEVHHASGQYPTACVLAFSQAVATTMRWIAGRAVHAERVVFWAGSLATDVDADALQFGLRDTEIFYVTGTNDQFFTPKAHERIAAEWKILELNPILISYEGVHELDKSVVAELLGR